MKRRTYPNEWRTVGAYQVHKFGILSTDCVIFAAYEANAGHSSFTTGPDGVWVGSVASRRLPAHVDAIPVGPERFAACDASRDANDAEAFAAIVAAFPEASEGKRLRGMGEIEMWVST